MTLVPLGSPLVSKFSINFICLIIIYVRPTAFYFPGEIIKKLCDIMLLISMKSLIHRIRQLTNNDFFSIGLRVKSLNADLARPIGLLEIRQKWVMFAVSPMKPDMKGIDCIQSTHAPVI